MVWASGVWAEDVWADGVWAGMGGEGGAGASDVMVIVSSMGLLGVG